MAPEKVTQLADTVAKAMPDGRRLECHMTSTIWNHWAKDGALNPAKEAPILKQKFTFRAFGPMRAVLIDPKTSYAHVEANGFHYSVATGERSAFVDRGSSDRAGLGLSLALQLDQYSPLNSSKPIAETLRTSTPISLVSNGSVMTYRFIAAANEKLAKQALEKDPLAKAWQQEILVDTSDPPRVLGWSAEVPSTPPWTDRWVVETWQTLDGKPFPQRVRREVAPLSAEMTQVFPGDMQIQIVEITDLASIPADVATPHPVAEGTRVVDSKLGFEFVAGSTDIVLKGRSLRLKEPLWEHPGDKLDELVRGGTVR
ncbi:MAG: hypothetical protein SGJ11_14210 [Phycisphaerae bacterium]|nr:hypothetical protein [Phycisphaerae bacterium]